MPREEGNREDIEHLSQDKFRDTIKRTIFIMAVAFVTTRILAFSWWITILAVVAGLPVVFYAWIWIRRLEKESSEYEDQDKV